MMSDREGAGPGGGAPERSRETSLADEVAASREIPPGAVSGAPAGAALPVPPADAQTLDESVPAPTEPTLRADPAVREFEVPFDTGELRSLPTGQLLVVHRPELAGEASDGDDEDTQRRIYSWIAAVAGVIGAAASLFVGWMLPLSIAAIVFGVLGLRREEEGRTLAFVGIGTGIAGLVFAAVWIGYYAIVFGALPH
jgi:hypothetical protein